MYINLSEKAQEDLVELKKENKKYLAKVWDLILDIFNDPFKGIGHPEPLKGDLQGWWSRHITQKHRMIYKVEEDILKIASCYGHYDDK